MPKIRIDLEIPVFNGQSLIFKSPADCSDITGLVIYYPEGDTTTSKDFKFVDAHGVDVGSGTFSLFAANSLVKVVLDIKQGKAFVQNADTNAYLEGKLAEKYSPDNKPSPEDIGASATGHKHSKSEITDFPTSMTPTAHTHTKSEITDFSHTHSKSEITDFPSSMTPTAHNQGANTITAGTFAGQVVANASGQTAGASVIRNSKLVSAEENPAVNGEICWMYE